VITLAFHDANTLAVRNVFEHKETLRGLSSYPDVRWFGEGKCWLVTAQLYDKLAEALGQHFAPLPVEFFERLPPRDLSIVPAKRKQPRRMIRV
jgi:hypothetical protein